jgi:sugar phosphate isomerase/epimerase
LPRQTPQLRAGGISFRDYPLEEGILRMKAAGYDGFEVWKPQLSKFRTPELMKQFVGYTKRLGLPPCALNDVDTEEFAPFDPNKGFERTVRAIRDGVELAGALGVRDVMFWEGVRPRGNNQSQEELLEVMIRVYKEAIAQSSKLGIRLLVEPHPFSLGMDMDFLVRLCDSLDQRYFGVLYDCCHFGVGKPKGYVEAIRVLGKRIKYIHFSDCDLRTPEMHYPPGTANLDIGAVLDAFVDVGFSGQISLDTFGYPLPEEASRIGIPVLRRAIKKLGLDR